MLRLLALLVSIAVASVLVIRLAQADPPEQRIANEISDLRQQVGPNGQVVGDQQEFAQAVRDVAEQEAAEWQRGGFSNESYDRPLRNGFENVQSASGTSWEAYGSPRRTGNRAPTRSQPAENYATDSPAANPYWAPPPSERFGPPHHGPPQRAYQDAPQRRQPSKSPQELLRTSAFELDRLAHGLEMAEQFKEADALREAAGTLRKSARKNGERESSDPEPAIKDRKRRRAARVEIPAKEKKLLKELEATHQRSKNLKAELLRIAKESTDQMMRDNDRKMLQRLPKEVADQLRSELNEGGVGPSGPKKTGPKQRNLLDENGRLPGLARPELPKRNLHLLAPPIGIHGGPTEGLEKAIDEARNQLQQAQPAQPAEISPASGD